VAAVDVMDSFEGCLPLGGQSGQQQGRAGAEVGRGDRGAVEPPRACNARDSVAKHNVRSHSV